MKLVGEPLISDLIHSTTFIFSAFYSLINAQNYLKVALMDNWKHLKRTKEVRNLDQHPHYYHPLPHKDRIWITKI
jgi:hypothetical protein